MVFTQDEEGERQAALVSVKEDGVKPKGYLKLPEIAIAIVTAQLVGDKESDRWDCHLRAVQVPDVLEEESNESSLDD